MFWIEVKWELCPGCPVCKARKVCNTRAIVWLGEGEPVYIDPERCLVCGKCVSACPHGAIHFYPQNSNG